MPDFSEFADDAKKLASDQGGQGQGQSQGDQGQGGYGDQGQGDQQGQY